MIKAFFSTLFMSIFILGSPLAAKTNQPKQESSKMEEAIFAMGCFWCGESEFRDHDAHHTLPGIQSIRVGYAGGTIQNPTYKNHPGYKEAIKIVFDPKVISYDDLLTIFWKNVDPLDPIGQFCDKGPAYTSVIFVTTPEQKSKALASKEKTQAEFKDQKVSTEITPYTNFYDAEDYHQNYKEKNPVRYSFYRWNCGRDQRLKELWGK